MRLAFSLGEGLDNFSKAAQTEIDSFEFKQVFTAHRFFFVDLFRPRQVTKVEFASQKHSFSVWSVGFDQKLEDGVRAG